ncbi:MAG: hypothetical protein J5J00_13340, partial [Deltaproteobacteria bacterium]|nr:hypothetical protein [Deltaproteobacteria bacterium]
ISPLSPNELKKTSQFSCPQFTTATRVYDSQNREDDTEDRWLARNSLFVGFHPDLGCDWEANLRKDAEDSKHGKGQLRSDTHFEGERTAWREVALPDNHSPGADDCTYYRWDNSNIISTEELGVFPRSAIPAVCTESPSACKLEYMGAGEGEAGEVKRDAKLAIEKIGIPTVQTYFPQARFNDPECKAGYCAEFTEVIDDNAQNAAIEGRMKVPTTLLKVLGKDSFEVSYRGQEQYEQSYATK